MPDFGEMVMDTTILIALCCHHHVSIVPPLCIPVQGGARIHPPIAGALPDIGPEGDISAENRKYCELTVQYYIWKNQVADYYGFCHYRRFFCFDERVSRKYIAKKTLSEKQQRRYFASEREIRDMLYNCDVLVPYPEDMGMTVTEYYACSKGHYRQDLELFVSALTELHPELMEAAEEYLSQTRNYFCNMFLMDRAHFQEYCHLLFSSLAEFDRRKAAADSVLADRTDGYLGERFLGIYITFLRKKGCRIKELARIDVECSLKKRMLYVLLPPESRRRFWTKKAVRALLRKRP